MKRLIVIINDSEATTKTTLSHLISLRFRQLGIKVRMAVTDDLDRLLPDTEIWDVVRSYKPSRILDWFDEDDVVVMDIASGYSKQFGMLLERRNLKNLLKDEGIDLTILAPISEDEDGLEGLVEIADIVRETAQFVLVHIPGSNYHDEKTVWRSSHTYKSLKGCEMIELDLPEIPSALLDELLERRMHIVSALYEKDTLPFFAQKELVDWVFDFAREIDDAEDFLMPFLIKMPTTPDRKTKRGNGLFAKRGRCRPRKNVEEAAAPAALPSLTSMLDLQPPVPITGARVLAMSHR